MVKAFLKDFMGLYWVFQKQLQEVKEEAETPSEQAGPREQGTAHCGR